MGNPWRGQGRTFSDSLTKRARQREVEYRGERVWMVQGLGKLGDAYDEYEVSLPTGEKKYVCDCHRSNYGEARAKKMCSHVLAVILWRKDNRDVELDGGVESVGTPTPASVDSSPVDVGEGVGDAVREYPSSALNPHDPLLTPNGWDSPPEWLTEYRPDQWEAAWNIVAAYDEGAKLVWLDAPTGAGKTAIADLVARILKQRAVYVCSSLQLQDQFLHDFPYARIIKGRRNYPTMERSRFPELTAADCDDTGDDDCSWCTSKFKCPYRVAKMDAARAQISVLNTAYWIRECQGEKSDFSRPNGFVVIDECDTLEEVLRGYVEFRLSENRLRQLGIQAPKKGSHLNPTIANFLAGDVVNAVKEEVGRIRARGEVGLREQRAIKSLQDLANDARRVASSLPVPEETWIRDNDAAPLMLKPVLVGEYGEKYLWRNGSRFLCMSATIISPDQRARDIGWSGDARVVRVPMRFPIESRPIHVAPVADMKGGVSAWRENGEGEAMARAIEKVLARHPNDRVLVHTVNYALAKYLMEQVPRGTRTFVTYTKPDERDSALARYRQEKGAVLFAPSFDRGVDLKGDDCDVIIVAKVPYPYFGDPQVNARSRMADGGSWAGVQTVSVLVQMTGRGMRSEEDWCTTFILDAQFTRNLWKRHKHLFPAWWTEALNMRFPTRELT